MKRLLKNHQWLPCLLIFFMCAAIIIGCSDKELEEKAAEIHKKVLTVDTHVDTPFVLSLLPDLDLGETNDPQSGSQLDFPRMQEGGLDAVFFAVFVYQGERTPEGNEKAKEKALELFSMIQNILDENGARCSMSRPGNCLDNAVAESFFVFSE